MFDGNSPHYFWRTKHACYGLVKGMCSSTIRTVIFVVPKPGENKSLWLILSMHPISIDIVKKVQVNLEEISLIWVSSLFSPYLGQTEYQEIYWLCESYDRTDVDESIFTTKIWIQWQIGKQISGEVSRICSHEPQIARDRSDFRYPCSRLASFPQREFAAKEISGKPLLLTCHATDFDRSGESVKQLIWHRTCGMHACRSRLCSSQLTKNTIIKKYGSAVTKAATP